MAALSRRNSTISTISEQQETPKKSLEARVSINSDTAIPGMTIFNWFTEPQLYLIACIYMSTKVFMNASMSYIPLYIQHTLKLESMYVALIPFVIYVTGFIASILLKYLTKRVGFKLGYAISAGVGLCK